MTDTHKKYSEEIWEDRELGATEKHVRKVSLEREQAFDEKTGLQIISIRLQRSLIDDLKELAGEDGLGYQPYIYL